MNKCSYNNELIRKRRKKKIVKRNIFMIVILSLILITLCFKLPYFNVKNIIVLNNRNIAKKDIIKLSGVQEGNNIFYINAKNSRNNILSNPYIMDVKIKRVFPSTLEITIKEREAVFYNKKGKRFVVVDKQGVVLEERNNINNMNLIKLEGMNFQESEIGKELKCDDSRKLKLISDITELITRMDKDSPKVTMIDIKSLIDINVYFQNMKVIIGGSNEFESKLNKAINILVQNNMQNLKGYIDVSFKGNPVVFIEK